MEYTACDNEKCVKHLNCKRFKMFTMGANDVRTNGGTKEKECKRYLPLNTKAMR